MSTPSSSTRKRRSTPEKDAADPPTSSSSHGERRVTRTPSSNADKSSSAPATTPFAKFMTRVVVGFAMIGAFGLILYGGHLYAWLMVVILQILLFRELVNVRYRAAAEKSIPWFRSVQVPLLHLSHLLSNSDVSGWSNKRMCMLYCIIVVGLVLGRALLQLRRLVRRVHREPQDPLRAAGRRPLPALPHVDLLHHVRRALRHVGAQSQERCVFVSLAIKWCSMDCVGSCAIYSSPRLLQVPDGPVHVDDRHARPHCVPDEVHSQQHLQRCVHPSIFTQWLLYCS